MIIIFFIQKINEKYIDWESTIQLNMDPNIGEDEKEIRLFKGTPLKILKLIKNNEELNINKIKNKIFYA